MEQRYYVQKANGVYTIRDVNRVMPLPFNFLSRHYVEMTARKFNIGGPEAVRNFYYVHNVAGTRPLRPPKPPFASLYREWMYENREMFE